MGRYVRFSGAFFGVLALVQLTRTVLGWPVRVADVTIPIWASALAFAIASSFAIWAFRVTKTAA